MSASAAALSGSVGERVELARYRVRGGERIVYGQRVGGCVRVVDRPSGEQGRSYLIERGLERDGYSALMALVSDYTRVARRLKAVPMATSIVRHTIEQEAVEVNSSPRRTMARAEVNARFHQRIHCHALPHVADYQTADSYRSYCSSPRWEISDVPFLLRDGIVT
jgi:hypothetical protein